MRLNDHLKSFVRPSEIIIADNPHFYHIKNPNKYFGINNKILQNNFYSNNYPIKYYKSPIYIAHYLNQSEETYTNRKLLLPRDDTGTFREIGNISEIHNQFNIIENNQPKNNYAENVKKFLRIYGHEY